MRDTFRLVLMAGLLVGLGVAGFGQDRRPIPYPVVPPPSFSAAVGAGTRTLSGAPGPAYWTNTARYDLSLSVSPSTARVRGDGRITYFNRSPDTLRQLYLHLYQNVYREGVVRNRPVEPTGGLELGHVAVRGAPVLEKHWRSVAPGYAVAGTLMRVDLDAPLPPADSLALDLSWSYTLPVFSFRNGHDGQVFFVAYGYPQMAVYDDLQGWHTAPYLGEGEFFMGYADYDVQVSVPPGYLVAATGTLANPDAVLAPQAQARLAAAAASDTTLRIVGPTDRRPGLSTRASPSGLLTWRYTARQVRDFAFGVSSRFVWDAAAIRPDSSSARTVLLHAFYRPEETHWTRAVEYAAFTIREMSRWLAPYPYPQMTAVEGLIGGGMEYPMITLIGNVFSASSLFGLVYHEVAHQWFPMVVGTNEKAYEWMDEGLVAFASQDGRTAFYDADRFWRNYGIAYFAIAGTEQDVEPMRAADELPYGSPAASLVSYNKVAVVLHALRGLYGQATFDRAMRLYFDRWAYRHPTPWDFFNTVEEVVGEDLDWFWTSLFFETWRLDHAVGDVRASSDEVIVEILDRGRVPMPAPVRVTYADGRTEERRVEVDVWLGGAWETTLAFPGGEPVRVEIDPFGFLPEFRRGDNVWTSPAGGG